MNIGDNIREIRKSKKISMSDLATKLGISVQAISQYELNKRDMGMELMQKIAVALEVPLADLLGSEAKPKFDIAMVTDKEAIMAATELFTEDQKSAFDKMYETYLSNLGILDGLKAEHMHFLFVDYLYLSVSFTEVFRKFNNEMKEIISNEKTQLTIDEVNSSIELTAKYSLESYNLLRKNMKLLEEGTEFYIENPDRPYFEEEIFENYLDK